MDFKSMLQQLSQLSEATKETEKGRVHTADPGGYGRKFDTDEEGDEKKDDKKEPAAKRGRGRPKKGADSETGQVAKYDNAKNLQSFMVGNLPKGKLPGKPGKKHTLKDWVEQIEAKYVAEAAPGQQLTVKPMPGAAQLVDPASNKVMATGDAAAVKNIQGAVAQGKVQMRGSEEMTEEGEGKKWIKGAIKHPGAFTKKAKSHGMTPSSFASKVLANKEKYPAKTEKQAVLAKTLSKLKEVEQPTMDNQTAMGAGLGAGRSPTTLESKKPDANKNGIPDYAEDGKGKNDLKKKKKVNESSHRHSSARLLGKSHALAKEAYNCRYDDMDEAKMYHEGYKEGLDECYGQGVYEMAPATPPATTGGMARQAMSMDEGVFTRLSSYRVKDPDLIDLLSTQDGAEMEMAGNVGILTVDTISNPELAQMAADLERQKKIEAIGGFTHRDITGKAISTNRMRDYISAPSPKDPKESMYMDEDEMEEGNAFTAALAKTPKGGKFSVGGKSFTDRSSYDAKLDELAFESLDNQLNALLESEKVEEGLTVSVSKGQQGMPDSVSIVGQDGEAEALLSLIKQAGLGLFGDDSQSGYGVPDGSEVAHSHGDIKVVGDHDGMMSLIKKVSGGDEHQHGDYEDEEGGDHGHETCQECGGMMEEGHTCEMVDEVESYGQEEEQVAENNPPDSGAAETTADENAEAAEDMALAKQSQQDKTITTNEGGDGMEDEPVTEWANDAGAKAKDFDEESFDTDIDFITKVISGGLNKQKSTGQTTIPVIAGQKDRMEAHESINQWKKLAGI